MSGVTSAENIGGGGGDEKPSIYDGSREVVRRRNEPFAEVHSNVVGPTSLEADVGTANQAASFGVSFADHITSPRVKNIEITVEEVDTPGGYDFSSILGYEQNETTPKDDIIKYAFNMLWSTAAAAVELPVPSPYGLRQTESADIDTGGGSYLDASLLDKKMAGLRWNLDLHSHLDGDPTPGSYKFKVTCSADVGRLSTATNNRGGFLKVEAVEQQNHMLLDVKKDD